MKTARWLTTFAATLLLAACASGSEKKPCGDGTCAASEDSGSCPADCPPECGDGICNPGEDSGSCVADCPVCIDAVCDLWPQCGCTAGSKCSLDVWTGRGCFTAGALPHGASCELDRQCAAGTGCIHTGAGWCRQFCTAPSDCPAAVGSDCIALSGGGGPSPGSICTIGCSLIAPAAACGAGNGCAAFDGSAGFATDCRLAGGSTAGCTVDTDCAPGRFCETGLDQCLRWCNRATGAPCGGGETCNAFSTPVIIGGVEYGACL